MSRFLTFTLIAGGLMMPALAAGLSMGIGARVDDLSGGVEVRFWIPLGQQTSLFIAPHGFGTYYFGSDGDNGFASAGLRTGIAFFTDNWVSPYVGAGGGYTRRSNADSSSGGYYEGYYKSEGLYRVFGGRAFVGLSVAPFRLLSPDIEWLRPLDGLRLELDSGLGFQDYYDYSYEEWSEDTGTGPPMTRIYEYENLGQMLRFPDIGLGIVFNW